MSSSFEFRERERGRENGKVGGRQAKLNESESGREPEKGGETVLTSIINIITLLL